MSAAKNNQSLQNLGRALTRLEEALQEPESAPLVVDGTIQRFEFVIELFWKTYKRLLADNGMATATPREAIKKAYQAGWIDDETTWLEMLEDRNATSHIYSEQQALRIYYRIKTHLPVMRKTFETLQRLS